MRRRSFIRKLPYSVRTIKSSNPLKSRTNEDRFSIRQYPTFSLFAIFDGHMGDAIANYSSLHFLKFLGNRIKTNHPSPEIITNSFRDFDQKLLEKYPTSKDGCTVTVVYIDKHTIITANAGDSPAILVKHSPDKITTKQISVEHTYENKTERKRITSSGGKFEDGYYVLGNNMIQPTRGFGDFLFKRKKGPNGEDLYTAIPTITSTPLTPSDTYLLLASDGVGKVTPILSAAYKKLLSQPKGTNGPKYIEQWITTNPQLFNDPPYYPDDLTTIVVDIHSLRKQLKDK